MFGFMDVILKMFGFTDLQYFIAIFCLVIFLCNLLGGLITSIILAYSGPIRPRRMAEKLSVRWCLFSDLLMIVFAVYYHAALVHSIEPSHVVYWLFALIAAPLLAFIGSQITGLVFAKRIEDNKREYIRRVNAMRAAKRARAEQRASST